MASGNGSARIPRHPWVGLGVAISLAAVAAFLSRDGLWTEYPIPYKPAAQLEPEWGRLVAVANITMHGRRTGADRIGFFRAENGTLWGLPLATPENDAVVLACAPPELKTAATTDTLAATEEVIGAADFSHPQNAGPSVYLLVRDSRGTLKWHRMAGSEYLSRIGVSCRERPHSLGRLRDPFARYHYFRISLRSGG